MTAHRTDVLGIGNAIVDVIARADEDFLVAQTMRKGAIDAIVLLLIGNREGEDLLLGEVSETLHRTILPDRHRRTPPDDACAWLLRCV